MANWNPHATTSLGQEWFPTIPKSYPIARSQPSLAFQLRSLAAETIGALRLGVGSNPAVTDRIFTIVDIYQTGQEVPGPVLVAEYPPNNDQTIGNWTTDSGGVVNLFASIDDAVVYPPSPAPGDYIRHLSGSATPYRCDVASAGFPATARVLRVTIIAVIGMVAFGSNAFVEFTLFHAPSSTVYAPPGNIIYTNGLTPPFVIAIDCGEINPQTLLPWTPADIQSFDSGTWHMRVLSAGTGGNGPIVTSMALRVSYLNTENRVAAATWRRPAGAVTSPVATDALVTLPSGAANWAKADATDYLYVPRAARDILVSGSAPVANDITWLAAQQDLGASGSPPGLSYPPPTGMASSVLTTDTHGLVTSPFVGELVVAPRIVLRTTAPADSADSQPYVRDSSTTVERQLTAAQQVGQRLTSGATANYQLVRFVVAPPTDTTINPTLTVRIRRVSDSVQFGSDLIFTADQIRALGEITGSGGFRYVQGVLSTVAALVSGTQYEIQLIVSAGTWKSLMPAGTGAGGVTFGGTTDFARLGTIAGGSSLTEQDMAIVLLQQPTAPATNVATVIAEPMDLDGCFCSAKDVDQIVVDWAATALGGSWARYEIERQADGGDGFHPVWQITSAEALSVWTDREPPMDRPVQYRVRVVSTASAFSGWRYSDWVTAASRGPEMVFTSNHAPALQVVYERQPGTGFEFIDHQSDTLYRIQGADYQVAFIDPRRHGTRQTFSVIANFARQPSDNLARLLNMDDVWEPLVAITRAVGTTIPYVCVRQRNGAVLYAHVELANGREDQPGNRYIVDAVCTRVAKVPTVGTS